METIAARAQMGTGCVLSGGHFKDENTKVYLYVKREIGDLGERARFPRAR